MEAFSAQSHGAREAHVPMRRITVTATARLHFGFLDPSGRGNRPFGSFGLSLDRPATRLVLERAKAPHVTGPELERAERYLKAIAASSGVEPNFALHLTEAIPPHAGLGSGTQLALAVGSAFSVLEGLDLSARQIATRLQRGGRSGHRHLHLRARWRRPRWRSRWGKCSAGTPLPAPLPAGMARASHLRCGRERACRSKRDGGLRIASRLSRGRDR